MDRYKKLFSNSAIFAIGNLGSKMITFVMVPLYTRYLTTSQYGQSDVLSTIVSLLTPILTLSIIDAVFRFAIDKASDNRQVLTNGIYISLISAVICLLLSPIIARFHYGIYVCVLTYASAIESMFQQFARGIGRSKLYASTGILMTIITVISNIIMIVLFGWGLNGYLASMLIAQIGGLLYLLIALKAWRYISFNNINKSLAIQMLIYSVPLIPNAVSWWLSNSANKIFIALMIGASANGIYAVANKIPSLISVFYTIFTQAWQISAVEEFKSKDVGKFFSTVLSATMSVLFIGVALLTLLSKILVYILSTPDYYSAWQIVPWLSLAVLYSCVSSFIGTVYTSSMKTGQLLSTTMAGAVINVLMNLIMIPVMGVVGAGVGAAVSFAIVSVLRLRGSRRFIYISVNWRLVTASQILILIELGLMFVFSNLWVGFALATVFLLIVVINVKPFWPVIQTAVKRFRK
ncbi:lipopolysaccharide biosynthesis protein [Lactiplantibacillus pentosus]|uniref:lipopolysaccharide biosynthesis protein n=1 Tax=Lactiplantibacillus pentosus TaxID=1589 RepID=UPI001B3715FB|nr:oligosaccharide flippase family protein [Lactiplantibacillus pentosus]MBQ0838017.1 oligosaccharide flippase family protein [Lactiplantibacillus pentosus]MBU7494736.1 oligosaccharide flippase family protein [Lactiplantibacillus pentosus]MBU7520756.1 oligosaccharide flippase family protein [Lactiplantibacillus pentosus]